MKKLGRNEPCHCGSGKKYKKCCLGKSMQFVEPAKNNISSSTATSDIQNKQGLLATTTGELHLPVRLYYKVDDKSQLIAALNQLQCVEQVAEDRWKLTYDEEAKEFGLSVKYNKTTQSPSPIVLGYIHLANDALLHVDVRSAPRASHMVEFIDRHVNRQFAKITHAASYTKVMLATKENIDAINCADIGHLFVSDHIREITPEMISQKLSEETDKHNNGFSKIGTIFVKLTDNTERPPALIERFPVYFNESGIKSFEATLTITEAIALKNYQTDKMCAIHAPITAKPNKIINENETDLNREKIQTHQLAENTMATKKKQSESKPTCGLCGSSSKKLTKTKCCDNWICDDEDNYVLFSFARNSCYRNHARYTLCAYHYNEDHSGRWQGCRKCKDDFELPDYVGMGTNEHNFEVLKSPDKVIIKCANCDFKGYKVDDFAYKTSKGYYCEKPQCQEVAFKAGGVLNISL